VQALFGALEGRLTDERPNFRNGQIKTADAPIEQRIESNGKVPSSNAVGDEDDVMSSTVLCLGGFE
jgi:hypothetical protein